MATRIQFGKEIDLGLNASEAQAELAYKTLLRRGRAYGRISIETPTSRGVVTGGPPTTNSRIVLRGRRGALLGVLAEAV